MAYVLNINNCLKGLATLVKDTWGLTTKIAEEGMESRFDAARLPYAALTYGRIELARGGTALKDYRMEIPFEVTYCMGEIADDIGMDTAREKCCNLGELLLDSHLPYTGSDTCSYVNAVHMVAGMENDFLGWARERNLPLVGAAVGGVIVVEDNAS